MKDSEWSSRMTKRKHLSIGSHHPVVKGLPLCSCIWGYLIPWREARPETLSENYVGQSELRLCPMRQCKAWRDWSLNVWLKGCVCGDLGWTERGVWVCYIMKGCGPIHHFPLYDTYSLVSLVFLLLIQLSWVLVLSYKKYISSSKAKIYFFYIFKF